MKRTLFISLSSLVFAALLVALYLAPNKLEYREQTIEVSYIAWACDCANWATLADIKKYQRESRDTLAKLSIFIEPADASVALPDTIGFNGDVVKLTGRFYAKKGFPKGYQSSEYPDKARVFRYTHYKILESQYKFSKVGAVIPKD